MSISLQLIILGKQYAQFGKDFDSLIKKSEQNSIDPSEKDITLDDTLLTPFSSGTTGPSKCVQLTHRNSHLTSSLQIDTLNVVPAILENLCHDEIVTDRWDLSSLTTVLCGSAPLSKELSKRFLHKFSHVVNLIQGVYLFLSVIPERRMVERNFKDRMISKLS
ncbi:hypothetical protein X798_04665 [Onchocerca flexuosa]|uniref:AMP-binding domain-containing protein n=1 Tax=Onchocerca flexuosa TaxID=387005 RepID=A0A238BTK7_9BILA|nr:hypothetical protein X798_04665 [Onchocerca flexuosa]